MFNPNTYLKILKYFGWSIARKQEVIDALTVAEADLVIETEVQAVLADLDTVCTNLQAELGNANAGLIKADVLEWESAAARSLGMQVSKTSLTRDLANLLGLEWSNTTICPGGAMSIEIDVSGGGSGSN